MHRVTAIFLGIITVIGLGVILKLGQAVFLPLLVAFLLSFIFNPVIQLFTRIKIPRIISIILVILMFFGLFFLIGLFLFNSAQSFVDEYPKYLNILRDIISDFTNRYLAQYNLGDNPLEGINWSGALKSVVLTGSSAFLGFVGIFFIIILILVFLFLETPVFSKKLSRAFPAHISKRIRIMLEHITRQISRYLGTKFLISFLTGGFTWLSLTIIGVDFPVMWGALAFFLNFIPNLGSITVVVVVVVQAAVQFYPALGRTIATAASMLTIQLVLGSLLDPKLQGERLNLSPVVILISLFFWGWLWGIAGAIVSVPIAALIKIICENIPYLKPVSVIMGAGVRKRRKRLLNPGK
ncbi:MAG: AI-2E family transporter [Spirochaetales bacterium]|nr:MAG: AI-2E family transporter [Spirochaetales bacterium]